jgi:hypothetical protein
MGSSFTMAASGTSVGVGDGEGVMVGGTGEGVAVGGTVGGAGVGVAVGGTAFNVAVGVADGGVVAAGSDFGEAGGGDDGAVGENAVAERVVAGGSGEAVGSDCALPHAANNNAANIRPMVCLNSFLPPSAFATFYWCPFRLRCEARYLPRWCDAV